MKSEKHWQLIGQIPHHGIALPLSALHSEKSSGIGEFYDLLPLIDWCKEIGFDCIQLLPLIDSGSDTSPYNVISSNALDFMYLSLHALPEAQDLESFRPLTTLARVATYQVKKKKLEWLRQYFFKKFPLFSREQTYLNFVENRPWLKPYALFKAYKTQYQDTYWKDWPKEAKIYPPSIQVPQEKIEFYMFLQYLCYLQLKTVKDYATSKHIFLKGDLPFLLSPDSADVWENPSLFRSHLCAGAPPDFYNQEGQKWGFPIPNWEAMEQADFSLWKQRLKTAEDFFHLYRIDHVVGLFRIWAIPLEKKAKEGFFIPKSQKLWAAQGEKLLEMMLETSPLLPIAEDLGTIPNEVFETLKNLHICGTKIIRWQRNWDEDQSYIPYSLYNPLSMTSVSTQDSPTLKGWWEEYPEEAKAFARFKNWSYETTLSLKHIQEILYDAHHTPSYFHINLLQEYLSVFPELSHKNPKEERINIPGYVLDTNWTYRFIPSVEKLIQHTKLKEMMQKFLL